MKKNTNSERLTNRRSNFKKRQESEVVHRSKLQKIITAELHEFDYWDAIQDAWWERLQGNHYDDGLDIEPIHPLLRIMWFAPKAQDQDAVFTKAGSEETVESTLNRIRPSKCGLIHYVRESIKSCLVPENVISKNRCILETIYSNFEQVDVSMLPADVTMWPHNVLSSLKDDVMDLLVLAPLWVSDLNDMHSCRTREELIAKLFSRHSIPKSLVPCTFFQDTDDRLSKEAIWFLQIARGGNLVRLGKVFGWRIPAQLQRQFDSVPEGMDFTDTLIFAEVLRLGGNEQDAQRLTRNPSFRIDFTEQELSEQFLKFWRETITWLIKYRTSINEEQTDKILAWAQHCYLEGNFDRQAPFSWKRRTPAAAIQASEAYYQEIRRPYYNPDIHLRWSNHGWDWERTDGSGFVWKFRELTSGVELFQEGEAMRHCVGSYASACANGRCTVFSLRCNDARVSTIELDLSTKQVVQARGRFNELTASATVQIIELWRKTVVKASEDVQQE